MTFREGQVHHTWFESLDPNQGFKHAKLIDLP